MWRRQPLTEEGDTDTMDGLKTAGRPKGAEHQRSVVHPSGRGGDCGPVDPNPVNSGPQEQARGTTAFSGANNYCQIGPQSRLAGIDAVGGWLRRLPGHSGRSVRRRIFCDLIMYPYARFAHRRALKSGRRSQSHIYTSFHRSPHQLEALTSRVIPFIGRGRPPRTLSINILACSTGAEPYTVTSELMAKFPGLDFSVCASDLHEDTIARAKAARYTSAEVFHNRDIPQEFVVRTFDRAGDCHRVKPEIRDKVSFTRADLLEPTFATRFEPTDIVFAQNVLFHLEPADAVIAFANILRLLKDRSALFVDGMELNMRQQITAIAGLKPLAYKCRQIHSHARRHSPARWWRYYYGAEPYSVFRRGRHRRYSTIFLKDAEPHF